MHLTIPGIANKNGIDAGLRTLWIQSPRMDITRKGFEIPCCGLTWGLSPVCLPSVYLTLPHVTTPPRPSPSVFAYCKRSKTGGGNSLGTRLSWHLSTLPAIWYHSALLAISWQPDTFLQC